jgi:cation transport ATPase
LVVADAEFLFKHETSEDSQALFQLVKSGLNIVTITDKSQQWLREELASHGYENPTIISHERFAQQSDRQIETLLSETHFFAELTEIDKKRLFQILKASGQHFILIGERANDETVIPAELRLLLAKQTASSLVRNATDILLFSNNIKEFLVILNSLQTQRKKIDQNEAFLKTTHYFCAAAVILAFLIGGGVAELIMLSLLILLGLWSTLSV